MYLFCLVGAWLIWHLCYRIRVVGRENLIREGGFVMVSNHLVATDPVFLLISRFFGRRLLVLAKSELFEKNALLSWYLRRMGGVPIRRGKGDGAVLESFAEKLRGGRGALIFPEGTRSPDGQLHTLKSGAFLVAARAGVPVQPCRLIYETGRPRFFHRVTVVFGPPLTLEELGLDCEAGPSALRTAKHRLTEVLEKLRRENED